MKNRFYLFWMLMLAVVSLQAQTLTISGTVTNSLSGAPVANHEVIINTDSTPGGMVYYNTVSTNPNGYYQDIIQTANLSPSGEVTISTLSCNGNWLSQTLPYGSGNYYLTADFQICIDTMPTGCQSAFYYYSDTLSAATQFIDVSAGNPVSWFWNFGDGTTSTDQNPAHIYQQNGNYTVSLTISTAGGCSSTSSQVVPVGQQPGCQANFTWYANDTLGGNVPNTLQFVDLSTGQPAMWYWNFGDGTTSTGQNPVHTYSQPGEYLVCLTIQNPDSTCFDSKCMEVLIGNPGGNCQALFTYYPGDSLNTTPPNTFQFVDQSQGQPVSWFWNFGDNTTSVEQNPSHTFPAEGSYTVCLTIVGSDSACSDTRCEQVWVGNPGTGCQAMFFYYLNDSINTPNAIQFVDRSTGEPEYYYWNFGDGTTSSETNPLHSYAQEGAYNVCLTIQNADSSCFDTYCAQVWIGNPGTGCQAMFTYFLNDSINTPNAVQFVDQSSGNPEYYYWNFGDGTTSSETNPLHSYAQEGTYTVCLTIQNADSSCFDNFCMPIRVGNGGGTGCQAMFFYYRADSLEQSNTIQFVDQSIGEPTGWHWDFGDGSTSEVQNPIHEYAQPGIYNACLTISNPSTQCTDTICIEVWVNNIITGCENTFFTSVNGLTASFNGYMLNGDTAQYAWNFGDGATATGNIATHTYSVAGIYPVVLTTVTSTGCEFTSSQFVFVGDSSAMQTIQGTVMAGSAYPEGIVLLMPLTGIYNWGAQVTTLDSAGHYQFDGVLPGSYHILAIPYSVNGDSMTFLPTYYGDVVYWEQATVVTLGTALPSYDINLVSCYGFIPGPGAINGNITNNGLKSGMSDVTIILLDEQNRPLVFDRSNAAGDFDFSTLAYGTYTLWAEVHGANTIPVTLNLSADNPTVTVNLKLSGNSVMGIGDASTLTNSIGLVYPNPVSNTARVNITTNGQVKFEAYLFNTTGQTVLNKSIEINGSGQIEIETGNLPSGVYNLLITGDDGSKVQRRFIKAGR